MRPAAKPHGASSQARVCFLRLQESVTDAGDVSIEARVCAMDGLGFGFSQIIRRGVAIRGGEHRCVGVECSTAAPGSTVDES